MMEHINAHRFVEAYHPQAPMADMELCPNCFANIGDCGCWDDPDPIGEADYMDGEVF